MRKKKKKAEEKKSGGWFSGFWGSSKKSKKEEEQSGEASIFCNILPSISCKSQGLHHTCVYYLLEQHEDIESKMVEFNMCVSILFLLKGFSAKLT